jgi:3',5'-cyclic AMP phosphodiesterase CpdA
MPVFVIPGNHDSRDLLRASFCRDGYLPKDGFCNTRSRLPVRLVALDTHIPAKAAASCATKRLAWLDAPSRPLPDSPTLLLMHHPPFRRACVGWTRAGLRNSEALQPWCIGIRRVERILCGHLHRAIDRRFAGTIAGTAPSTAHQMSLNLARTDFAAYKLEPAGYQLHLWRRIRACHPHRRDRRLARPLPLQAVIAATTGCRALCPGVFRRVFEMSLFV